MAGGDQAASQQPLLVLTIQDEDFHDEVLVLADQGGDFGRMGRMIRRGVLANGAVAAEPICRVLQLREELLARLVAFELGGLVGSAERPVFTLREREDILAELQMRLQVLSEIPVHNRAITVWRLTVSRRY